MSKNNFLLLSLEDDKINSVANAVSNKSGKKILEQLTEGKATESELAKKLNLAISTVHYNLQQLMKAGLVTADEYHYSAKGREVLHYKLANKYIIIAPRKKGLKEFFKNILPVLLITAGIAGIIEAFSRGLFRSQTAYKAETAEQDVMTAQEAVPKAESAGDVSQFLPQDVAIWFFAGAAFALGVYLLLNYYRRQ